MPIVNQDQTQHQVLDPSLLGRPVHLLPRFAARLAEDLGAAMQAPGWRRNWSAFRLETVEFGRAPEAAALRWLGVAGEHGTVAVAFERRLLLGLLNSRYGRHGGIALPAADAAVERVTATEERLAVVLTQQLAELLSARLAASLAADGVAAPARLGPAAPLGAPGKAAWAIRAVLRAAQSDDQLSFWMAPDQDLMAAILQGLLPENGRTRLPRAAAEPLAASLQVRLDGRLVSKEITLAALFGLQVGDVIPVTVGRADVLLDESRLFTAAVAEHKGKLCLTSFEDAE
ncbi:MAG: FliM/FliN family flagellar motor switch protein [Massilia sp.]